MVIIFYYLLILQLLLLPATPTARSALCYVEYSVLQLVSLVSIASRTYYYNGRESSSDLLSRGATSSLLNFWRLEEFYSTLRYNNGSS
jgi:hypothetical protein